MLLSNSGLSQFEVVTFCCQLYGKRWNCSKIDWSCHRFLIWVSREASQFAMIFENLRLDWSRIGLFIRRTICCRGFSKQNSKVHNNHLWINIPIYFVNMRKQCLKCLHTDTREGNISRRWCRRWWLWHSWNMFPMTPWTHESIWCMTRHIVIYFASVTQKIVFSFN